MQLAIAQANTAPQQSNPQAQQQNRNTPEKDYSGMYDFLREGEFVQITAEDDNEVIGLISRYRNQDLNNTDENGDTFIEQMFKSGKLEGVHLSFLTEDVEGIAYEFHGEIVRGDGKARSDEGYYVLKGALTESKTNSAKKTSSSAREVVLKSFPQNLGSPSGKNK